jgi:flagellar basal body-associated protein FliL
MPKFCEYCGAPLREDSKFCHSCGHPVVQSAQPSQPRQPQNTTNQQTYTQQPPQQAYAYGGQPPYQQPQKKKGGCCLVALIVLLVMLAALGIGGYFFYKFANDKFEDAKEMIEETIGVPLPSIISSENREELEKPDVTSEDIDKPNKAKKGKEGKKIAVKDEDFSGVTLPFPDMGVITNNFTDFGTQVYYFDKISYQQFIEYCEMLEALPGWVAHEKDNVAHFPKDYNEKMMTLCVGDYNGLHVVVKYLSDSFIEGTDMSHLSLQVKNKG